MKFLAQRLQGSLDWEDFWSWWESQEENLEWTVRLSLTTEYSSVLLSLTGKRWSLLNKHVAEEGLKYGKTKHLMAQGSFYTCQKKCSFSISRAGG